MHHLVKQLKMLKKDQILNYHNQNNYDDRRIKQQMGQRIFIEKKIMKIYIVYIKILIQLHQIN